MIQTDYQSSGYVCPYCDNVKIRYSDSVFIHYVRMFVGARKRYCPKCKKKWQIKSRYSSQLAREVFLTLVVGGLGFGIFLGIVNVRQNVFDNKENVVEDAILETAVQGFQLLEQSSGGRGLAGESNLDPYRSLLGKGDASHQGRRKNITKLFAETYEPSNPRHNKKLLSKAESYLRRYQNGSSKDKEKLIRAAKAKLNSLS